MSSNRNSYPPLFLRLGLTGPLLTFRDVADALSKRAGRRVGLGTVHRYAKGIEPTRPAIRAAFGLPPFVAVKACPACGIVHVKRCPNKPRPPAKPRIAYKPIAKAMTWVALLLLAVKR